MTFEATITPTVLIVCALSLVLSFFSIKIAGILIILMIAYLVGGMIYELIKDVF